MRRGSLVLAFLVAGFGCRADDFASPPIPSVATVAQLPASAALGTFVFVTDCRAVIGATASALSTQDAGTGTGCLATFGSAGWQIAGTAAAVTR